MFWCCEAARWRSVEQHERLPAAGDPQRRVDYTFRSPGSQWSLQPYLHFPSGVAATAVSPNDPRLLALCSNRPAINMSNPEDAPAAPHQQEVCCCSAPFSYHTADTEAARSLRSVDLTRFDFKALFTPFYSLSWSGIQMIRTSLQLNMVYIFLLSSFVLRSATAGEQLHYNNSGALEKRNLTVFVG